jgi:hypothetical protein
MHRSKSGSSRTGSKRGAEAIRVVGVGGLMRGRGIIIRGERGIIKGGRESSKGLGPGSRRNVRISKTLVGAVRVMFVDFCI